MKVNQVFVNNYRAFRSTFTGDAEAKFVIDNLKKEIQNDLANEETAHIKTSYWPSYDDEGFAEFEVKEVRFFHGQANVKVEYITTAK